MKIATSLLRGSVKRKLPPSFSLTQARRDHEAARCIQKYVRLRRSLSEVTDPLTLEKIPLRYAFSLCEPTGGLVHWFDVRSFVSYLLSTACFHNPLSRRDLHSWEVSRLIRSQPSGTRSLIRATFLAKDALQRYSYESEGMDIVSNTITYIDACLQELLKIAENNFFDFSLLLVVEHIQSYEDLLVDLHSLSLEKARATCLRHKAVLQQRGILCPLELLEDIKQIHASWEDVPRGETEERSPEPLLKEWILQRLKFK